MLGSCAGDGAIVVATEQAERLALLRRNVQSNSAEARQLPTGEPEAW